MTRERKDGWLSPYRVIDLTDERGLLAGQMLAKLGAEVIQVEPPEGSSARRLGPFDEAGRSLYWSAFAAGKKGLALDIDAAAGRARLEDLLAGADILIDSAAPGVMSARGLDHAALSARFPGLICVSITPFGGDGPKRDWAAADLTLWAAGGPLFPHGDFDGPPLRISATQAWLHASADAAAGALIALLARQAGGRGQSVDISAQQSITPTTLSYAASAVVGHDGYNLFPRPPRPATADGAPAPLRGPKWRVADGLAELTVAGGPPFGQRTNRLFAWMREEGALPSRFEGWDWSAMPMRPEPGDPLEAEVLAARDAVADFLAPKTKAELERAAVERGLLLAPVNTIADLLASAHLRARDFFVTVEEDGARRVLPGRFAHGPAGMFAPPRPSPRVGEHDEEVFGVKPPPSGRAAAPPPASRETRPASSARKQERPRDTNGVPTPALAGLKVLDLAWVVAGPALGRAVADFGATVVRVESSLRIETARLMGPYPGGVVDPQRCALFDTYNAGKLGLTLDISNPAGAAVVRDLARWADVVVESFVPGQMARWGLSPQSLLDAKPRLIVVSTALMGQTGPSAALSGYGNVGAAMAGFQSLVGRRGETPIGPYGPYTDFIGPRFGLAALLAAIDHQRRTGNGGWLDVSQAEAGIQFLAAHVAETDATARVAGPLGNRDPQFAPHGVFACAGEDRWIAIVARDDDDWGRLAGLIGGAALDARFTTVEGRKAEEDRLEQIVEAWTRKRDVGGLERALQERGVPAHRAADSADLAVDPQLAARGHFVRMPHPLGGECVIEASRFRLSETPARYERPAPHFGRDNHAVLTGILGYPEERVRALATAGALR